MKNLAPRDDDQDIPIRTDVRQSATFTIPGTLVVGTGQARYYFYAAATVINVVTGAGTAPTGASLILDLNKNGTTMFTTQGNRPTIAASGFLDASSVPDVTSIAANDYLTVDVDQIGSTIAGADAVLTVVYYWN